VAWLAGFVILGEHGFLWWGGEAGRVVPNAQVGRQQQVLDEDSLMGRENHCTNINFSTNQTSQSFS